MKQLTDEKWCTMNSKVSFCHVYLPDHVPLSVLQVQPNNYCTFYDDQRQNWSVMFESEKASLDFCKEVSGAGRDCEKANREPPTFIKCYVVYQMLTSFLWWSSGVFGESEQCSRVRCCGGSGSECRWGPGGGERRLSGGGVHRVAPAEPHRRTGHTLPIIIYSAPSCVHQLLWIFYTWWHTSHWILRIISDVWLQPEQGQVATVESWCRKSDQSES